MDSRNYWDKWRWRKLLNPEVAAIYWKVNPRHFQNAASWYLYKLALKAFYSSPLSTSAIFCYIKLKQFEEDLLTSVAEGLALGLDCNRVFEMLEVMP
jgi:vacuolar-type H+-ATPase subunit C/Vma6